MNSEFVKTLRRLQFKFYRGIAITDGQISELEATSNSLVKECQNLVLNNTDIGKKHIYASLVEIEQEHRLFKSALDNDNKGINGLLEFSRQNGNRLNPTQQAEIESLEISRDSNAEVLNQIQTTKSYLYELLITYYPDLEYTESGIEDIRNTMPRHSHWLRLFNSRINNQRDLDKTKLTETISDTKIKHTQKKYTYAQIALIYIYNNLTIKDSRAYPETNDIAEKYGQTARTRGAQLFDYYKRYLNQSGRLNLDSQRSINTMIGNLTFIMDDVIDKDIIKKELEILIDKKIKDF